MQDALDLKLRRLHEALGDTRDDIGSVKADVGVKDGRYYCAVDFSQGASEAELANGLGTLIANIACLKDHLGAWCLLHGLPFAGDALIDSNLDVGIIHDLWIRDKHYTIRKSRSKLNPDLRNIRKTGAITVGGGQRAGYTIDLHSGQLKPFGDGKVEVIIDADVFDGAGKKVGGVMAIAERAIAAWEAELIKAGVHVAARPEDSRVVGLSMDAAQGMSAIELSTKKDAGMLNRAILKGCQGDYTGAIADASAALAFNDQLVEARVVRSQARIHTGDLAGAMEDAQRAIEFAPTDPRCWVIRGSVRGAKGEFDTAIADFNQAITLDPTYANAYINRGVIKSEKCDYMGAAEDFTLAIERVPNATLAYFNRAVVREKLGDKAGSQQDYEKTIALSDLRSPLQEQAKARIALLRS